MMDRQCERCKTVTMIDSFHRVCFDCFSDLDLKQLEEEEFQRFLCEEFSVKSINACIIVEEEEE
jgi:hypothetical protein